MPESKLTTVFFPKDTKPFYRKAIVEVTEVKFFMEMGAHRTKVEVTDIMTTKIGSEKPKGKKDGSK